MSKKIPNSVWYRSVGCLTLIKQIQGATKTANRSLNFDMHASVWIEIKCWHFTLDTSYNKEFWLLTANCWDTEHHYKSRPADVNFRLYNVSNTYMEFKYFDQDRLMQYHSSVLLEFWYTCSMFWYIYTSWNWLGSVTLRHLTPSMLP